MNLTFFSNYILRKLPYQGKVCGFMIAGVRTDVLTAVDAHALNGLGGPCCVANPIPFEKKEQVLEILEVVVEQELGSELISSKFEAMK